MTGAQMPDPADVTALTEILELLVNFPSNEQRARYLLTCNWMRDRSNRHPVTGRADIRIDRDVAEQILATIRDSVPWVTRPERRAALDMAGHRLSGFIELTYQEEGQAPLFGETEGEDDANDH